MSCSVNYVCNCKYLRNEQQQSFAQPVVSYNLGQTGVIQLVNLLTEELKGQFSPIVEASSDWPKQQQDKTQSLWIEFITVYLYT